MRDPYGNFTKIPAAIVNLDQGVDYQGHSLRIGDGLVKKLIDSKPADFRLYQSKDGAEAAVRRGDAYFALILPPDFSSGAMKANSSDRAKLELYDSQGGNYFAARIAQTIALKASVALNAQLAEARWKTVDTVLARSSEGSLKTNVMHTELSGAAFTLPGDAAGRSTSVEVVEETNSPVANNGEAFAPYFLSITLWIGILILISIFDFKKVGVRNAQQRGWHKKWASILESLVWPALLCLAQSLLAFVGLKLMGIKCMSPGYALVSLILASLCYLIVIYALIMLLGDMGSLVAAVVLIVQIGASGGSYPIELSPPFFQSIHAYTPIAESIAALRNALLGANEGGYLKAILNLVIIAIVFLAIAFFVSWLKSPRQSTTMEVAR